MIEHCIVELQRLNQFIEWVLLKLSLQIIKMAILDLMANLETSSVIKISQNTPKCSKVPVEKDAGGESKSCG